MTIWETLISPKMPMQTLWVRLQDVCMTCINPFMPSWKLYSTYIHCITISDLSFLKVLLQCTLSLITIESCVLAVLTYQMLMRAHLCVVPVVSEQSGGTWEAPSFLHDAHCGAHIWQAVWSKAGHGGSQWHQHYLRYDEPLGAEWLGGCANGTFFSSA